MKNFRGASWWKRMKSQSQYGMRLFRGNEETQYYTMDLIWGTYLLSSQASLHKKWSFPLRISLKNVTKSSGKSVMENFIFCAVLWSTTFKATVSSSKSPLFNHIQMLQKRQFSVWWGKTKPNLEPVRVLKHLPLLTIKISKTLSLRFVRYFLEFFLCQNFKLPSHFAVNLGFFMAC